MLICTGSGERGVGAGWIRNGWFAAFLGIVLAFLGGGALAASPSDERVSPGDKVFELVDRVVAARPFTLEGVAEIVGFGIPENRRGKYFRYGKASDGSGVVASVDVRERLAPEPGRDGLVILDLTDGFCIGKTDVVDRFGATEIVPLPPSPHAPADVPEYHEYTNEWGALRFGFARAGEKCLVSVVFDAAGS